MRNEKAIREYCTEAEDRVSWVRKQALLDRIANGEDPAPAGFDPKDWLRMRMEAIDRGFKTIAARGYVKNGTVLCGHGFEYWEGIMAALRWVLGDDKDSLDT